MKGRRRRRRRRERKKVETEEEKDTRRRGRESRRKKKKKHIHFDYYVSGTLLNILNTSIHLILIITVQSTFIVCIVLFVNTRHKEDKDFAQASITIVQQSKGLKSYSVAPSSP